MATHIIIIVITLMVMTFPSRGRAQLQLQSHVVGCGGSVEASTTPGDVALSGTIGQVLSSSRFFLNTGYLFEGFWVPWQFEVTTIRELGESEDRLRAYPNPFSVRATLFIPATITGAVDISMFTMTGERVREFGTEASVAGETSVVIDALDGTGATLPAGLYVIEVRGSVRGGMPVRMHQFVHLVH